MKPTELKTEFIRLRAEGASYSVIAEQLHISKTTCCAWEKDLQDQISELKRAELAELCESYGMTKEARIKNLGDTLRKIDDAIAQADFTALDPAKLLDFKLRYTEALKEEYVGVKPVLQADAIDAGQIVKALGDLLNRVQTGEVGNDQAQRESGILAHLLKAYDTLEVKTQLTELQTIIGGTR